MTNTEFDSEMRAARWFSGWRQDPGSNPGLGVFHVLPVHAWVFHCGFPHSPKTRLLGRWVGLSVPTVHVGVCSSQATCPGLPRRRPAAARTGSRHPMKVI